MDQDMSMKNALIERVNGKGVKEGAKKGLLAIKSRVTHAFCMRKAMTMVGYEQHYDKRLLPELHQHFGNLKHARFNP